MFLLPDLIAPVREHRDHTMMSLLEVLLMVYMSCLLHLVVILEYLITQLVN